MKDNKNFEAVEAQELNEEKACTEQCPEKVTRFRCVKEAWRWIKENKKKLVGGVVVTIIGGVVLVYCLAKSAVSGSDDTEVESTEGLDAGGTGSDISTDSADISI